VRIFFCLPVTHITTHNHLYHALIFF
jgi:hypothetical protein